MLTILGFSVPIPFGWEFLKSPTVSFLVNLAAWIIIALAVNFIFTYVLRKIMRRMAGEIEDILVAILRWPLLILLISIGLIKSLRPLPLSTTLRLAFQNGLYTIVTLLVLYLCWRIIKDILVFYGNRWARKTESRVDDILIPILNLFGPMFIVITGTLIILPMWGINITSVLVGAGLVGLVLGLALQDTLSNIFSGVSLLIEAPFRTGDLVILSDGRVCEVEHMGMRSTRFYSVDEHSTIYVPNKTLASATLTNIAKPTVEQKYSIFFDIDRADFYHVQEQARQVALAHPSVVISNMGEKIASLNHWISVLHQRAAAANDEITRKMLLDQAEKYTQALPQLEVEGRLNHQLLSFREALRNLIRGIKTREDKGLNAGELQEIFCRFVAPSEDEMRKMVELADTWSNMQDPWVSDREQWDQRALWQQRNHQVAQYWDRLKKEIQHPTDRWELRLDDMVRLLLDWLDEEYRVAPQSWKDPTVTFSGFEGDIVHMQLWFYVDNVRLEHDERDQRVRTEIARELSLLAVEKNPSL